MSSSFFLNIDISGKVTSSARGTFNPLLNDIENQKYPEVVENPLLRSTANCTMPTSGTFSHSGSHNNNNNNNNFNDRYTARSPAVNITLKN